MRKGFVNERDKVCVCGLPALLSQPEQENEEKHDSINQALRHPNVRFSTTWAQNQPLAEIWAMVCNLT